MGTIVTFYSYKGGVGRSMALANVAVLLARRGKKVLAVDWDLEAPGLTRYFARLNARQDGLGLLPFLLMRRSGDNSSDYNSYLWKVEDTDSGMSFDVLPSGHEADPEYSSKLERFDWHDFFSEGGGNFFEQLRAQWKAAYDAVLIDSRTGLTDSGGICTIQMPDIVVAMFTANFQSLYGVRDVMRLAQQSRQRLSFDRMLLNVIPLPCRFGTRSEFRESKKWLDEFAKALGEFFADWLPSNASPRQVLERMKIPQVDYFSFGERLAVVEDSSSDSEGMMPPYNMLTDLIESDLRNLDTILTPESWQAGFQREPTKPAKLTGEGYQYDIYLSHPGDVQTATWIRERFLPILNLRLEMLSPKKLTTFFDLQEVRTGSHWDSIIGDALKRSRVCIAFLAPQYFRNPWSVSELETFLKRSPSHEEGLSLSLVLPVLLAGDPGDLSQELRGIKVADFRDYFTTSLAFQESPKSVEFEDAVLLLARDLRRRIENAPPFNPDWHVVNLVEVDSQASLSLARYSREAGKNARALAHLAQALGFNQRFNRSNSAVATLTGAMLTQASWPILLAGPMSHDHVVTSAQFSPDGRRVVTASEDKTARIWETVSGKCLVTFQDHAGAVWSAVFSPDAGRVLTASNDKTARIWEAGSGKCLAIFKGHIGLVDSAVLSPDGQWVLTASGDKTARLWDALSGKPIGEPMRHEARVRSAQFSPDGQRVVTASEDYTARLWEAPQGKRMGKPMGHGGRVRFAQFSPDGQRVVTASEDKTARLWDASSGGPIGEPMGHEAGVRSARFSPDGQRVVTASEDKTAQLWDALRGKPMAEPMQHGARVYSAQFSPDGQRVVTASGDNTARICVALSNKAVCQPMQHGATATSAQFSPDGRRVVTASVDKLTRLWDAFSGKPIGEPMRHGDTVTSAQFSPDGQRIVTVSVDTAQLWNAFTGKLIGEPMRHEARVRSTQFSPDGQRVVTACGDGTARFWDALSGKPIGDPMRHGDAVISAEFTPDGQRVVTASVDKTARLWNVLSGKPMGEPMQHGDTVTSAQFSPDGQRVITASVDKTARLWDALSGKPMGEPMLHGDTVTSALFSPNGQRVVTAAVDMARLWNGLSGKPLGEPMRHEARVRHTQFSPDGQRVVTASGDHTARLWDALSGKPIGESMQHGDAVIFAQFSPDGQRVVTASVDKTALLWDFPTISEKDSAEDVRMLADLAEATSGIALTSGQEEIQNALTSGDIRARREKIAISFPRPSSELTALQRLLKWSVSDPRNRTISPCSQLTVAEWIENAIKEGVLDRLRVAIQFDTVNARLAAHLGRRLADYALKEGTDPDQARRARAEADFQARRAFKLAPDNDEVKKLRAETAKLLQLNLW